MKSAIGIGALLMDGLGDTIRVSLTGACGALGALPAQERAGSCGGEQHQQMRLPRAPNAQCRGTAAGASPS